MECLRYPVECCVWYAPIVGVVRCVGGYGLAVGAVTCGWVCSGSWQGRMQLIRE